MVWKHPVQIESIDLSGFLRWANGLINRTLLAVRRFRDTEKATFFGATMMSTLRLRLLGRLSRTARFCRIVVVVVSAPVTEKGPVLSRLS